MRRYRRAKADPANKREGDEPAVIVFSTACQVLWTVHMENLLLKREGQDNKLPRDAVMIDSAVCSQRSADHFIVYRQSTNSRTILAGLSPGSQTGAGMP